MKSRIMVVSRMSSEEFLDWEERQLEKHEFIQGEIFAMVGVTRQHATVAGNLFRFLGNHLSGSSCRVYMADMKLKLEVDIFRKDDTEHWVLYDYESTDVVTFSSLGLTIDDAVLYENVD